MSGIKITGSLEDYLETIAEIIDENGHAHTKDIATRLNVKMPSVTNALRLLSAAGLVRYKPHYPVELTPGGLQEANAIRRRHEVLRTFFRNILKLPSALSEDTACKIEHLVDEEVVSRFLSLIEAIETRPDCDALRAYLDLSFQETDLP